jgi:hypothetical protein
VVVAKSQSDEGGHGPTDPKQSAVPLAHAKRMLCGTPRMPDAKSPRRNRRALAQTLDCMFNIRTGLATTPDKNPCRHEGEQTLADTGHVKEVVPAVRILARLQR